MYSTSHAVENKCFLNFEFFACCYKFSKQKICEYERVKVKLQCFSGNHSSQEFIFHLGNSRCRKRTFKTCLLKI